MISVVIIGENSSYLGGKECLRIYFPWNEKKIYNSPNPIGSFLFHSPPTKTQNEVNKSDESNNFLTFYGD